MASTSSLPSPPENTPNWLELPPELTAAILHRLGPIEILFTAQKVCVTWRKICNDRSMWKSIDMGNPSIWEIHQLSLDRICRHAVDLSSGLLEKISVGFFATENLFHYIADRSPQLKSLRVARCDGITEEGQGLGEIAKKLPNLEELQMFFITMPTDALESFGHCCPKLKSMTYNLRCSRAPYMEDVGDKEALAIAQNMSGLRHLSLFGNQMTNKGLDAILNGCPHLDSLDLRQCFNVDLNGAMGKTCAQRIRSLKRPNDSTEEYEFDATIDDGYGDSSFDDDDPIVFSDVNFLSDDYYFEF